MVSATQIAQQLIAQAGGPVAGGGPVDQALSVVPLVLIILVMYFLLIRPAKKQQQDHKALLGALKKDDRVVTSGGICARVLSVEDTTATLEIADKVKIRILKERISGLWDAESAAKKS